MIPVLCGICCDYTASGSQGAVMYWVYMVRCEDDSLYTGLTTDVPRRVQAHNREAKGARYTRARRPVTLVWQSEPLPDRSVATRREQQIKALTRQQKLVLVASGEA